MGNDSDAILRHLEANPLDKGAGGVLADTLAAEDRDPVLAFGVRWLFAKDIWLTRWPTAKGPGFSIDLREPNVMVIGIERMPFNNAVVGNTVEEVLRIFSAHLWGLRVWMETQLFAPVPLPKRATVNPTRTPPTRPALPVGAPWTDRRDDEEGEEPVHPWRSPPWLPARPWRRHAREMWVNPMWWFDSNSGQPTWEVSRE